jgi:4-hydroxybenzoate polyprenyltransferase
MSNTPLSSFLSAMWSLLRSHVDAWGVAFVCAMLPLWLHEAFSLPALWLVGAVTSGYWLAFAINDYFDAAHDAHDPVKAQRNLFAQREVAPRRLWGGLVLVVAFWLPAFLQFGWRGAAVVLVGGLVMWAYSAPPLRLKSRPILDLITHALFVETFPYWVVLVLIGVGWKSADYAMLLILLLASLTAQLEQQLRDYAVDLRTDRNFTTTYGPPVTRFLLQAATLLLLIFTTAAFFNATLPLPLLPLALIALPILLRRFGRKGWNPAQQALSYWLAVVAGLYLLLLSLFWR